MPFWWGAGWRYIDCDPLGSSEMEPPHLRVGYAAGPIVAQAVPMASQDEVSFERSFCLLGCLPGENTATFTIRRTPGTLHFVKGVTLSLTMDTKEQVRKSKPKSSVGKRAKAGYTICR